MTEWSNDVDEVKGGSFTNVVDLEMEDCTMSYDGIKLSSNAFKKVPKGTVFSVGSTRECNDVCLFQTVHCKEPFCSQG